MIGKATDIVEVISDMRTSIIGNAMSPELDEDALQFYQGLREAFGDELDENNVFAVGPDGEAQKIDGPEDMARNTRRKASKLTESLDNMEGVVAGNIDAVTKGCPGPLTMRAEKAGQVVTATVCMSPASMGSDLGCAEIALVKRQASRP